MAHFFTLLGIKHSPRTAYFLWANGLVEVQNRTRGTHLRMFVHNIPKTGHFKSTCMLTHTIHNPFQNSMFLLMKLFFTHDQGFYLLLISTSIETRQKYESQNIAPNFQNTHIIIKRIQTHFFTKLFPKLFRNSFLQ